MTLPTRLHVSPTLVSGVHNHVNVYWNGWTCFFDCQLTYTLNVYVLERRDNILVKPSLSRLSINRYEGDTISFLPFSGMNVIELTITHRPYTQVVRSYVLVDRAGGSSVALSTSHKLHFTSANSPHWQTDQNQAFLSVSWENHFYNTYIRTDPSLLFRIERPQNGYDVVAPPLSYSGIETNNHSGIVSFELTLYQNNSLIASKNFSALEQSYQHSKPFQSGETYEVNVIAIDVFGHEAHSSAFVYTDFSQPTISDVDVWKREHSPIRDLDLCSKDGNEPVYTLELTAIDEESGIETIEWTSSNGSGQFKIDSQYQVS